MDDSKKKELLKSYSQKSGKKAGIKYEIKQRKKKHSKKKFTRVTVYSGYTRYTPHRKDEFHHVNYDFLRYSKMVFKWATSTYKLSRAKLDLLLYVHPLGKFQRKEIKEIVKTLGLLGQFTFKELVEDGWIEKFNFKTRSIYQLTPKATYLCEDMHLMCLGKKPIPNNCDVSGIFHEDTKVRVHYVALAARINQMMKEEKAKSNDS